VWELILPEYRIAADDKRFPAGLFLNVRLAASPQPCKTAGPVSGIRSDRARSSMGSELAAEQLASNLRKKGVFWGNK
ncbi:hypothetical protein P5673_004005, partial [Acropora cervicornis]